MACNQYIAPNGESSILADQLVQKYGDDIRDKVMAWIKTLEFQEKYGDQLVAPKLNPQGEPTLDFLQPFIEQMIEPEPPKNTSRSQVILEKDKLNAPDLEGTDEENLTQWRRGILAQAKAFKGKDVLINLQPNDTLTIGGKQYKGAELARLFKTAWPDHIKLGEQLRGMVANLPENFLMKEAFGTPEHMEISPESKKRMLDAMFIRKRDAEGNPTGEYFSPEMHREAVGMIRTQFLLFYDRFQNNPSLWMNDKSRGKDQSLIPFIRTHIRNVYNNMSAKYQQMLDTPELLSREAARRGLPEEEMKDKLQSWVSNLRDVLNSYYIKGDENNIWAFMRRDLERLGIRMERNKLDVTHQPDAEEERTDEQVAEDRLNNDITHQGGWNDTFLRVGLKDTASVRIKSLFLTIADKEFAKETAPAPLKMKISYAGTISDILEGRKKELVISAKYAKESGLTPKSELPANENEEVVRSKTERIVTLGGKQFLVTADHRVTGQELNRQEEGRTFGQRITEQEGRRTVSFGGNKSTELNPESYKEPQPGDVYLRIEPFVPRKRALVDKENFVGRQTAADYDRLWKAAQSVLTNREPSVEGYLKALRQSPNPNLHALANRIEKSPDHIKKGFVNVMSSNYNKLYLTLFHKAGDYIDTRVIESNRGSELQSMLTHWQQVQKQAPILTKGEEGLVVINREVARGFWDRLLDLHKEKAAISKRYKIEPGSPSLSREQRQQRRQHIEEDENKLNQNIRALLIDVLEANGIVLHEEAINTLMNPVRYSRLADRQGSNLNRLMGGFSSTGVPGELGNPNGLLEALINRLYAAHETPEGAEGAGESYQLNNPLYSERSAMMILARAEYPFVQDIKSSSFRNAEGETVASYGLNTAATHAVRRLREAADAFNDKVTYPEGSPERAKATRAITRYEDSPFAKRAWLLRKLKYNGGYHLGKLGLSYVDGINNDRSARSGTARKDMSMREQWLLTLSMYMGGGKGVGHMISLTHADKTTTPLYTNVPLEEGLTVWRDGKPDMSDQARTLVYRHVFLPEAYRMLSSGGDQIKGPDGKVGYKEGKNFFYFLPKFNREQMQKMVQDGLLTEGEFRTFWVETGDGWKLNDKGMPTREFKQVMGKLLEMQVGEMVSANEASIRDSGLLEKGLPGNSRYYTALRRNAGITEEMDGQLSREQMKQINLKLLAHDYTINSLLFNTSLAQMIYGDPALFFRKEGVGRTLTEYGKRLAGPTAPGKDGEWSHSPTFTSITLKDYEPIVKELKDIPGYEKPSNGSDAQAFTLTREHLNTMYAQELITQKQWEDALAIIDEAGPGGYYTFEDVPELTGLHGIFMNPLKPVINGLQDPVGGVMPYQYIKFSSYPLYPPAIRGMEMDKLRVNMEKAGVDRANFISAHKAGTIGEPLSVFKPDGKIDEGAIRPELLKEAMITLSRRDFRLQQDTNYDETHDTIPTISQLNKNITESIQRVTKPFKYRDKELSGQQLRLERERLRKKLITAKHADFLDKVGGEKVTDKDGNEYTVIRDKNKLWNILAREASTRPGYTDNDILALKSYVNKKEELRIPLYFLPSASKMERMMMSLVSDISRIYMPGHSYIQASPAGFRTLHTWEEMSSSIDQSDIVWAQPFEGELKTARKGAEGEDTLPAQVLVSAAYFRRLTGEDISNYIHEDNGRKMLDMERIPRELLQLVGARIPNQGHSSSLPMEVTGFLPESMGDIMVVPAAITKQMGSDFDVDKIFAYNRLFRKEGDKFVAVSRDKKKFKEDYLQHIIETEGERDVTQEEADRAYEEQATSDELKNDYFDLHWSILTHPDMLEEIQKPLDRVDLKQEAKLAEQQETPYFFNTSHQLKEFMDAKNAKIMVAQMALDLSGNAEYQDRNLTLSRLEGPVMEAVPVDDPFFFADDEGNIHEFNTISGFGESTYNGETRTKADNMSTSLGEAVDYAKEKTLGKVGLNPQTSAAWGLMNRLQTPDKGTPGEEGFTPGLALNLSYHARLMTQPLIQEYVSKLQAAGDSLSSASLANLREQVLSNMIISRTRALVNATRAKLKEAGNNNPSEEDIIKHITSPLLDKDISKDLVRTYGGKLIPVVNPRNLLRAKEIADTPAGEFLQLKLLGLFGRLSQVGSTARKLQTLTNQVTRGAGETMLDAIRTDQDLRDIGTPSYSTYIAGIEQVMYRGDDPTEVKVTYDSTIPTALDAYGDIFPYRKLEELYTSFADGIGGDQLSVQNKRVIFNAAKAFVQSSDNLGLFGNASNERMRLMFSRPGHPSLALRVEEAKRTWGKDNYLLQRLQPYTDPNGVDPDRVEYDAVRMQGIWEGDDSARALGELLDSPDESRRTLGWDLVRYFYATGGIQETRNFGKIIPWSVIEGTEIAEGLRMGDRELEDLSGNPNLREQIYQHNPHLAKQMGDNMSDTGSEYETPPARFEIPAYDPDTLIDNPAKNLLVTYTRMGEAITEYPEYLSYRADNGWVLYKKEVLQGDRAQSGTVSYRRIDTLGGKGIMEYDIHADGTARSIFYENRASLEPLPPAEMKISNESLDFTRQRGGKMILKDLGLLKQEGNYLDIENALTLITASEDQPKHLRVVADMLRKLERNPAEAHAFSRIFKLSENFVYKIIDDPKSPIRGRLNTTDDLLTLNAANIGSPDSAAETIEHEMLHRHTALLALAMDEPMWDRKNFSDRIRDLLKETREYIRANPEVEKRLLAIDEVRKIALNEFKRRVIEQEGKEMWERIEKGDVISEHYYGMSSLAEFIPHALTNDPVMQFLNNVQYEGPKSVLEHIRDIISSLWRAIMESLGANPGTLLEESVKRVLDLVTYKGIAAESSRNSLEYNNRAIYDQISNASIATPAMSRFSKVMDMLVQERDALIGMASNIPVGEERIKAFRRIRKLRDRIKAMRNSQEQDMSLVTRIAEEDVKWINNVADNKDSTINEINAAIRASNLWRTITDYIVPDPTGALIPSNIAARQQELITMGQKKISESSAGFLRPDDWKIDRIKDVSGMEMYPRNLSSAATDRVTQYAGALVEKTALHADQEIIMTMNELQDLKEDMMKASGGDKEAYKKLEKSFFRNDAFGRKTRFSQKYFDKRAELVGSRNRELNRLDRQRVEEADILTSKKDRWTAFWSEFDRNFVGVDTRRFFNADTGEFKPDIEKLKKELANKVGEDNVDWLIERAQAHYKEYLEHRESLRSVLQDALSRKEITAEEMDKEFKSWIEENSPNAFFNHRAPGLFTEEQRRKMGLNFSSANERYVVVAPLKNKKEFWEEGYDELINDPVKGELFKRYSDILDRLISYLPQHIQDQAGAGFLPIVRRSLMENIWNFPQYLKTINERLVKSIGAAPWKEEMNDQDYSKIPIEYLRKDGTPVEERADDLIGIAKLFALMAVHYRHFSAARGQIEAIRSILKEIDQAKSKGLSHRRTAAGKLVPTHAGIGRTLQMFDYQVEHSMLKRPRKLEGPTGMKIYSSLGTDKSGNEITRFSLNPWKQKHIRDEIFRLTQEKQKLDEQASGENPSITLEEYQKKVAVINKELSKYEPYTIYLSKAGDKLITLQQLKAIAYNPFSAISNVAFGWASLAVHATGGADFGWSELKSAFSFVSGLPVARMRGDHSGSEKLMNILDNMGILGDYVDTKLGKAPEMHREKSRWKKLLDPYSLLRSTDLNIKGITTVAILKHQKVKVIENGVEKEMPLWDVLDKNGEWNAEKYGKNPLWTPEGHEDVGKQTQRDAMTLRVKRVNMILHGNVDKNSTKLMNRFILGRLIGQFRGSWLPEGFAQRFQSEREDPFLGRTVKGRYRSLGGLGILGSALYFGRSFLNLIPGVKIDVSKGLRIKDHYLKDSEVDLENMRRNFAELSILLSSMGAIMMLKHVALGLSDDEEDEKKLWAVRVLINQIIRGKQDIDFYASPQVFTSVTRDIIPAFGVIKDYKNLLDATGKLLYNDDYTYQQWLLRATKAGLPIPQATMVNRLDYLSSRYLDEGR